MDEDTMMYEREPASRKRRIGTDLDTVPLDRMIFGELNNARPTWEDMIIAYSTIPGMKWSLWGKKGLSTLYHCSYKHYFRVHLPSRS